MTSHLFGRTVLITGGAGYVAAGIVGLLRELDCRILRLMRPGRQAVPVSGKARLQDVTGDVCERRTWDSLLPEADVVFHLAAQTSVYQANEDPSADFEANVRPMLHLLETCRQKGQHPIVVFAGTATEAGIPERLPVDETHPDRPITVYDLHKWMAEIYLRHYAREGVVRGVTLRLANAYGPGPRSSSADRGVLNMMIRRALRGEKLTIYGCGDHLRDYVYVEDVSRAFLEAALNIDRLNGGYFVIGSGKGHTLKEAINLVADRVALKLGRRVGVVHVDPPVPQSPIEARNFVADSRRYSQATGWQARYSLPEGIDRTIEAFLCES
jgi:nucleoside-diphosphate-sugar epimerase